MVFHLESSLTLPAHVAVGTPHMIFLTEHPTLMQKRQEHISTFGIIPFKAVLCILGRDDNHTLGDLSSQVMKYTFFREGHAVGPSDWGIYNDKTMIYSGEVQEGESATH